MKTKLIRNVLRHSGQSGVFKYMSTKLIFLTRSCIRFSHFSFLSDELNMMSMKLKSKYT